jgi:hypothetical protein
MKKLLFILMLLVPGFLIAQNYILSHEMGDEAARGKLNAVIYDEGKITLTSTHSADSYKDFLNAEWTPTTDMASGGTNGIYSIINPIFNVSNAYGLRARVDMRDQADSAVEVNQLHGIDGLFNLSDQDYDVVDNMSVFGGAIHAVGITAGDVTTGTLNLYYGAWGPSTTKNFTAETNGMLLVTHASTNVDYGVQVQSSSAMTAGLYLLNHPSNSPATMTSGILMESAASGMTYGVNMTGAGITGAEILCQNGATIDNIDADTLDITETIVKVSGTLYVTGDISSGGTTSDWALTDEQPELEDYWAKTLELNKLPAFEGKDRQSLITYLNGLEETTERLLRYIVAQDARIAELEENQGN